MPRDASRPFGGVRTDGLMSHDRPPERYWDQVVHNWIEDMAKHTKQKAEDFMTRSEALMKGQAPEGFDDLPQVSSDKLDIRGWVRPSENLHIYGYLISTVKRKAPRKNQAEKFLIIKLAAPMTCLILPEDRDDEAAEGLLEAGQQIGLDMRQFYNQLDGRTGKVHIHFIKLEELEDGNPWWNGKVYADLTSQTEPSTQAQSNGSTDDIPF